MNGSNRVCVFVFLLAITGGMALVTTCPASADPPPPCTLDRAVGTTIDPQPFLINAYGCNWCFAANKIAFMAPDPGSGFYRLFLINPDGTNRRPLTSPALPTRHLGCPNWFPSGKYILLQAEKAEWKSTKLFGSPDYEALPGFGLHDDLWLITPDGKRCWQLTNDPNTRTQGILLPRISPDGKLVAWSARQPDKKYKLTVADFVAFPQPHLQNLRTYQPGGPAYYETGAFTSDCRSLMYTSDQDTKNFWQSQIYRLDLATGRGVRLTQGTQYNEHPVVVKTPTGDWVVYMSDKNIQRFPGRMMVGADWWAMRPDGSGARRLTVMNLNRPNNPECVGQPMVACTIAVSPGGDYFLGDVQDSLTKQTGLVKLVRFVGP